MSGGRLQFNPDPIRVVPDAVREAWEPAPFKTMRVPGVRTTDDWRVGLVFEVKAMPGRTGVCISVTPWGNDRIRWIRLRHPGGTECSYAPNQLTERSTT